MLRRFEAFGISTAKVITAQAFVTCGLVVLGATVVLAFALPTYGMPRVVHRTSGAGDRAAAPLSLYLRGGGAPPKGVMRRRLTILFRWILAISALLARACMRFGVDKYPPFTGAADDSYAVRVHVAPAADDYIRVKVFFRSTTRSSQWSLAAQWASQSRASPSFRGLPS